MRFLFLPLQSSKKELSCQKSAPNINIYDRVFLLSPTKIVSKYGFSLSCLELHTRARAVELPQIFWAIMLWYERA